MLVRITDVVTTVSLFVAGIAGLAVASYTEDSFGVVQRVSLLCLYKVQSNQ